MGLTALERVMEDKTTLGEQALEDSAAGSLRSSQKADASCSLASVTNWVPLQPARHSLSKQRPPGTDYRRI